ncbi:MAG TPA: LPS export ABC transporter periplasmic protein LptC [Xanthomonadaceae bacterium]|nr:LPS export ABC transporter periplasmic protein LptC [Xanthomonadaceae bacterium]
MSWRGMLTLVLLAAALVTGWSVWNHRAPEPLRGPASGRSDYQLYDFELVVLDEQGNEAFTLRAPRMSRQPGDESLDLATPTFLFPVEREEGGPALWTMHSDRAWISPEGDEVRLLGNVRADGPGADGLAASMRTERLDVFPRAERAESDQRVTVSNGGSIIHSGRGLRMDLANRHYQFLSDVEFRYVPLR